MKRLNLIQFVLILVAFCMAYIAGIAGASGPGGISSLRFFLVVAPACLAGCVHGYCSDGKGVLQLGCAAVLLVILNVDGWGHFASVLAQTQWIGFYLVSIWWNLIYAFEAFACASLFSRFFMFDVLDGAFKNKVNSP